MIIYNMVQGEVVHVQLHGQCLRSKTNTKTIKKILICTEHPAQDGAT